MAQKNSVTQKSASKHFASFQTKKKLGCIEMVKIEDISNIKNHKKSKNLFFSFVSEHYKIIWQKIKTTLFETEEEEGSLTRKKNEFGQKLKQNSTTKITKKYC